MVKKKPLFIYNGKIDYKKEHIRENERLRFCAKKKKKLQIHYYNFEKNLWEKGLLDILFSLIFLLMIYILKLIQ